MIKKSTVVLVTCATLVVLSCIGIDLPMVAAIKNLDPTGSAGIRVSEALKLPKETFVCIVEPYGSRILDNIKYARNINNYLKERDFRGDEGHWTIIYGTVFNWKMESVHQSTMDLLYLKDESGARIGIVCGESDRVLLVEPDRGNVTFKLKRSP